MLHADAIGATGAAKTSSVFIPAIFGDIMTKLLNEDAQKKVVLEWIKKGWAYITKPFEDKEYSINYIKPNPGYEEKFKKEVLKYRSAGMTVMAPDDSLTDKVYDLGTSKGCKVNRIDARRNSDGTEKEGSIGFNPLYISPLTPEWRRQKEIIKNATLFADIMQIVYEMSGKSDPYFSSINRIATTTIAITLMVTYPKLHKGKQPTLTDVESIINNIDSIRVYADELDKIDRKENKYRAIRDTINQFFLGPQRQKFEEHSNGLRVQLTNFLMDPEIRRILSAEKSIDLDKVLQDGEITVVNIELGDLGPVNSPAFGLFFSVAFQNAVLSRPGDEWTRLPHFWYIDEFPIIVSPSFEQSFVLFRKFRTSMFVAMQTLDQFNKNPFLKYLKGIILNSCSHHFIFGRTNIDDGDIVSKLSGMVDNLVATQGTTKTSMMNENPSLSMMDRYTVQKEARVTAEQQRYLDFQEITYFITRDGRALPPSFGKVYFLPKKAFKKVKRFCVNWKKLMEDQTEIVVSKAPKKEIDDVLSNKEKVLKGLIGDETSVVQIDTTEEISHEIASTVIIEDHDMNEAKEMGILEKKENIEELAATNKTENENLNVSSDTYEDDTKQEPELIDTDENSSKTVVTFKNIDF
jgi:hypothetical protein